MDPIRLTILKRLCEALERISIEDGFSADLAGGVFRGRDVLLSEEDPLPLVNILETEGNSDWPEQTPGSASFVVKLHLLIQGFADFDETNPTDPAHRMMDDVKRVLLREKRRINNLMGRPDVLGLGGYVSNLEIGTGWVAPPEMGVCPTSSFLLPLRITYADPHLAE